jgi:hypothetical protein
MKIGILTQPLYNNYGGILQNYALQKTLKDMGHEVWTIDRRYKDIPLYIKYGSIAKRIAKNILGHKVPIRMWITKKEEEKIATHTHRFVNENIRQTKDVYSTKGIIQTQRQHNFDAFIIGSDQVWRPQYSPCLTNYFLDFVENDRNVKKIAYGASFGVDCWEYSKKDTNKCARLAKKFDAISVRENSAIDLCKRYLGVKAVQVLDPTLLLDKTKYIHLVEKDHIPKSRGKLFVYILDRSKEKDEIVKEISNYKKIEPFEVMPTENFSDVGKKKLEQCIFPPVTEWLRAFIDAEYIITDSFHGTVFSIIFEKPFIAIGNEDRGLTRFSSLLNLFQLEKRLINYKGKNMDYSIIDEEIDYSLVNSLLQKEKDKSINFLSSSLKY